MGYVWPITIVLWVHHHQLNSHAQWIRLLLLFQPQLMIVFVIKVSMVLHQQQDVLHVQLAHINPRMAIPHHVARVHRIQQHRVVVLHRLITAFVMKVIMVQRQPAVRVLSPLTKIRLAIPINVPHVHPSQSPYQLVPFRSAPVNVWWVIMVQEVIKPVMNVQLGNIRIQLAVDHVHYAQLDDLVPHHE